MNFAMNETWHINTLQYSGAAQKVSDNLEMHIIKFGFKWLYLKGHLHLCP